MKWIIDYRHKNQYQRDHLVGQLTTVFPASPFESVVISLFKLKFRPFVPCAPCLSNLIHRLLELTRFKFIKCMMESFKYAPPETALRFPNRPPPITIVSDYITIITNLVMLLMWHQPVRIISPKPPWFKIQLKRQIVTLTCEFIKYIDF